MLYVITKLHAFTLQRGNVFSSSGSLAEVQQQHLLPESHTRLAVSTDMRMLRTRRRMLSTRKLVC